MTSQEQEGLRMLEKLGFRVEGLSDPKQNLRVVGFCKDCGLVLSDSVLRTIGGCPMTEAEVIQKSNEDATKAHTLMRAHVCGKAGHV